MPVTNSSRLDSLGERRDQILRAAMSCFAKSGFHQTSMHDISDEAGISVGLIYRYFDSKDAVISAMAHEHEQEIKRLLARARGAGSLLEALEIFFTAHCCGKEQMESAFVVDLFAEGSRNPRVAKLVRSVLDTLVDGVTELIGNAPEMQGVQHTMTPRQIAELIFASARGMLMRDVVDVARVTDAQRRDRQLGVVRGLWHLLFTHGNQPALA